MDIRRLSVGCCLLAFSLMPIAVSSAEILNEEVPASIGTCQHPDFFFLNVSACPVEITEGQAPRDCQFSASRYLRDRQYHPSSMEELLGSLRPGVPVCVLIHGAFVKTELAAQKSPDHYARILHAGGNRPLHLIAIHWRSDINICPYLPSKLNVLERRADAVGFCIARLLSMLPPEQPVCLLGHSYGSRVTAATLQFLSRGQVADPISETTNSRRRIRVVFTASTLDHHWLNPGQRFEHTLHRAECLINFRNRVDPAMTWYPFTDPLFHHTLGLSGFTWCDKKKIGWQAEKITDRSVTIAVGFGHMIERYYATPEVMNWMIGYIYFD